ncbi:MAG: hypothetical protein ABEJ75_04085 [Candidatus Nanohaloarchaea archaeon]
MSPGGYRKEIEEGSNPSALRRFGDVLEEAAERYAREYPGEVEVSFQGPLVHVFPGPAAGTDVSNYSSYRIESEHGWEMDVRVELVDHPYHVDELMQDGKLDLDAYIDAFRSFDPEETRTREARFSLETDGHGFDEEELDRWFAFNQRLEDILEPEDSTTRNSVDYIYMFDLMDTRD